MSKEDKINKIRSFLIILFIHLIKRSAEQRTTRSWEISIQNYLDEIHFCNKRRKSNGFYLTNDEMRETTYEAFSLAIRRASLEAFEGTLTEREH